MKTLILIQSGIGEDPLIRLEHRTPLEAARHPAMDEIVASGIGGRVRTIPDGMPPLSEVGCAVLFGRPGPPWPGRGALEVAGRDLRLPEGALVFRANLMTVIDGRIVDHTAGGIRGTEAEELLRALNRGLAAEGIVMHGGGGHRVLAAVEDPVLQKNLEGVRTSPPQQVLGNRAEACLPTGPGAERLVRIMERARRILETHDVNRVRLDLGENPATDLWFWGGGRIEPLPEPAERYAYVVSDSPVVRGLARMEGWGVSSLGRGDRIPSLADLRRETAAALRSHEMVVLYSHRADEATHLGDAERKVREIEAFDREIVAPLLRELQRADSWRISLASDHRSLIPRRRHDGGPTPMAAAGTGIEPDAAETYCEASLASGSLDGKTGENLPGRLQAAEGA